MKLAIEFLGLSRRLTQTKEILVDMHDQASFRDLLRYLASQYPTLVGQVIVPETFGLVSSYLINIDGQRAVTDLDARLEDGQRLIFMFAEAGG